MKLKLLFFGILIILFSVPLMVFLGLTYFNCGFINDNFCCQIEGSICCFSLQYSGCINTYNNMESRCEDYCFEFRSKVTAGFDLSTLIALPYCQFNCSNYYPCPIYLLNGTILESLC